MYEVRKSEKMRLLLQPTRTGQLYSQWRRQGTAMDAEQARYWADGYNEYYAKKGLPDRAYLVRVSDDSPTLS